MKVMNNYPVGELSDEGIQPVFCADQASTVSIQQTSNKAIAPRYMYILNHNMYIDFYMKVTNN